MFLNHNPTCRRHGSRRRNETQRSPPTVNRQPLEPLNPWTHKPFNRKNLPPLTAPQTHELPNRQLSTVNLLTQPSTPNRQLFAIHLTKDKLNEQKINFAANKFKVRKVL